jgi:type IV pilus assembly protein PilB
MSSPPRLRIGQLLVDARLLKQEDLDVVLAAQRSDGRRLGTLLVERGLIDETKLTQILSHQLSVPWVSLLHVEFSRQLLNLVPQDVVDRYCLIPIYVRHVRNQGDTLYVAMDDPSNEEALRECKAHAGLPVRAMIAPPSDIRSALRVYYPGGRKQTIEIEVPVHHEDEPETVASPVVTPPSSPPSSPRPEPAPRPVVIDDTPEIETVEVEVPLPMPPPSSTRSPKSIPPPRAGGPRMIALTLLDGTTITLPARKGKSEPAPLRKVEEKATEPPAISPGAASAPADGEEDESALTARDLVAALRAVSHGADAQEVLGDARWESMFAALLSLLLRKHVIADWEFVEELKKM